MEAITILIYINVLVYIFFIFQLIFGFSKIKTLFKLYPDYYETITNPIDMKTIAKRVRQGTYKTLKQMEADFILMTENAKRYNAPKSVIYKDACKLKILAKEMAKALSKQITATSKHRDNTH